MNPSCPFDRSLSWFPTDFCFFTRKRNRNEDIFSKNSPWTTNSCSLQDDTCQDQEFSCVSWIWVAFVCCLIKNNLSKSISAFYCRLIHRITSNLSIALIIPSEISNALLTLSSPRHLDSTTQLHSLPIEGNKSWKGKRNSFLRKNACQYLRTSLEPCFCNASTLAELCMGSLSRPKIALPGIVVTRRACTRSRTFGISLEQKSPVPIVYCFLLFYNIVCCWLRVFFEFETLRSLQCRDCDCTAPSRWKQMANSGTPALAATTQKHGLTWKIWQCHGRNSGIYRRLSSHLSHRDSLSDIFDMFWQCENG